MRIVDKYIGILFAALALSSCITTQSVPIDQLEPGIVTLPAPIRKVALISRNFKFSFDTLSEYSNLNFRLQKVNINDNILIDSISVTKSLDNLRKELLESGRVDEVFVYPFSAIKSHIGIKELPLSQGFINSICKESETNAVISLEMLSFFYSCHNGSGREIKAEANVKITAIWSVYTPESDKPIDRFTHSDVIRWKEYNQDDDRKFKLPGRKEAISIACGVAAKNYSKRVVPNWIKSSRSLIGINEPEFDKALSYARNNKWKAAAQIWKKYLSSPKSRVAGIAALNYAISQEMLGDSEQASLWSEKSVILLKNGEPGKIARAYAAILYERKLKAERLNSLLKVNR
jgi:hypothetical protein